MAETILFINLAERVLGMLSFLGLQEVGLAWGVVDELKRLEGTWSIIKAMLLDAEENQGKKVRAITIWLKRLQDAFYEASNLLDEFRYQVLLRQVANDCSIRVKVRNFFSCSNPLVFQYSMSRKVKKIRKRLDGIANDRTMIAHLIDQEDRKSQSIISRSASSGATGSDFVGRARDRERILQLLMTTSDSTNVDDHEIIPAVIPIVGLGGVGKTRLVKSVYDDERALTHFELRMWVKVEKAFNVKRVVQNTIRCISSTTDSHSPNGGFSMTELRIILQEKLHGRRFLLVLDDVRNCDNRDWVKFSKFLRGGADGSKIIVTTRNKIVASTLGTVPMHSLGSLSDEDCHELLLKWAGRAKPGEQQHVNLLEIGKDIAKNCKGYPVAAKTLGSSLFRKTNENDWLYLKDNEPWELEQNKHDVFSPLRLSYDPLTAELKRCFTYCSIFPKNHEIEVDKLIQLWMAQGLIIQSSGLNHGLEEDTGAEYLDQLCSIFFLDKVEQDGNLLNTCRMPEIVHDLAVLMAKKECLSTSNFRSGPSYGRVKHVSFCDSDCSREEVTKSLFKLKDLRTVLFPFQGVGDSDEGFVHRCIARFKYLRVLDFSDSCFEVLPDSIGNLKHLRFLDISGNANIKTLPKTICKLYHLQTLRIWNCLQIRELPKNIGNLISLRHLYLTTQQSCLPEKEILRLKSLQSFRIAECGNLTSLPEGMHLLTALRTVTIISCPKLTSLPSTMKNVSSLRALEISNCPNLNLSEWENFRGLRRLQ